MPEVFCINWYKLTTFILIKQSIWESNVSNQYGKGWERTYSFYQACLCIHFVGKKTWNGGDNGKWQSLCSSTPLIPCLADTKWFLCPVKWVPSKVGKICYHLCTRGSHMEKSRIFYPEKPQETWTSNALLSLPRINRSWFSKKVNSSKPSSGVQTINTIIFSEPGRVVLLKYSLAYGIKH